jgi:uncharacterized protein involved in exopolysaccharide biosynthesis
VLPGRKYKAEDILAILWRRKWLILAPLVICSLGTYAVAKRLPDMYRSETLILVVPQKVPESYVRSTVSGSIEDRIQSLKEQILSRSRLERIILDFDLYHEARQSQPLESEENVRDREKLAVGTSDFLQTQLDDARRRLIEQEKRLEQYRLRHAGQLPNQAPFNLQAIQNLRLELQNLDGALARARDRQATLERQMAEVMAAAAPPPAPAAPAGSTNDPTEPVGATVREQLEDGRRKLAVLEARLKPQHPDVARLRRRITRLEQSSAAAGPLDGPRERRARELRTDLDATVREIAARQIDQQRVRDEMNLYQSRLDAAPIREAELTELTRDYETIQQIYRGLLAKREDSKMAANLEQRQIGEQFRVLDPARAPSRPFSPNRTLLNLIGVAAGLVIGLGATAALEYLDMTLKTEDDVRLLLGLPVIATIPLLTAGQPANAPWRVRVARRISVSAVVTLIVDSVRNLRG